MTDVWLIIKRRLLPLSAAAASCLIVAVLSPPDSIPAQAVAEAARNTLREPPRRPRLTHHGTEEAPPRTRRFAEDESRNGPADLGSRVVGRLPSQKLDSGAALRNPKHKLWTEAAPDVFRATFETTKGSFVVECRRVWAPHGVDRFYNLVRAGFFDDSRFFRVREGYIAQFGIPGDPAVAMKWKDQAMPDDPVRRSNKRGFIGYAMTGPNTRTTQIYVNLTDNARLDAEGFAPIGEVIEGMAVVDEFHAGYGEQSGGGVRAGKQAKLFEEGNAYLDREFPKLDRLLRARIAATKK